MAEDDASAAFRPGARVWLEVELVDYPHGDMANVIAAMPGFRQRFWVPTRLLRAAAEVPGETGGPTAEPL